MQNQRVALGVLCVTSVHAVEQRERLSCQLGECMLAHRFHAQHEHTKCDTTIISQYHESCDTVLAAALLPGGWS
eukprot:6200780-Pleurochrysis_carterae.AAC.10